MRILLFGTGTIYQRYKKEFAPYEIVALLDNDKEKQGTILDGCSILPPEEGIKLAYDYVFILVSLSKARTIIEQLLQLQVPRAKICLFPELLHAPFTLSRPLSWHISREGLRSVAASSSKRILVITENFYISGAAIVLLYALRILKKHGFSIVVLAGADGPTRESFEKEGFFCAVEPSIFQSSLNTMPWLNDADFDLIFLNTAFIYYLLWQYHRSIPVFWWLHDSEMLYQIHNLHCGLLENQYVGNVYVYGVSHIAQEPFQKRCPLWPVGLLPFGVPDLPHPVKKKGGQGETVSFFTAGILDRRKGQAVLIDAVRLLPENIRKHCRFYLAYQNAENAGIVTRFKDQAEGLPEIKFLGSLDAEQMQEWYEKCDAVICPSLEETVSAVCVEAMRAGVPCIVTTGVGASIYMDDGKSGRIVPAGDVRALAEAIQWVYLHREQIPQMGGEARQVYESYFSMDVFEKNLMATVSHIFKE